MEITVEKLSRLFGQKGEIVNIYPNSYIQDLELLNEKRLEIITENNVDGLVMELPAVLQCRDIYNPLVFLNDYVVWWPMNSVNEDESINIHTVEANWVSADGRMSEIDLYTPHSPARKQIILPFENHKGNVIQIPDDGTWKINFVVSDIKTINNNLDNENPITIEYLSSHTHPNLLRDSANFPMHSMQLIITNHSDHDINSIQISGIIYNENNDVIDFIQNSNPSATTIPFGESKIIPSLSFSQTGRCVGYSDPNAPYNIRYWVSYEFQNDKGEMIYDTNYDEIVVGEL